MRALIFVLVVASAACGIDQKNSIGQPLGSSASVPAEFVNGLPYDGCSWVVKVDQTEYAPDLASTERIKAFANDAVGKTSARITFELTGAQGTVECGWNTQRRLPEITVGTIASPH